MGAFIWGGLVSRLASECSSHQPVFFDHLISLSLALHFLRKFVRSIHWFIALYLMQLLVSPIGRVFNHTRTKIPPEEIL